MPPTTLGSKTLFDALDYRAYLNHAAVSPPSAPVRSAVSTWLDLYAQRGLGAVLPAMEQRSRLKQGLSRLLGCEARDLAMTSSTTRGLMEIASGIQLRTGDGILCFTGEFPTNITPWQTAAAAAGADVHLLDQESLDDDDLLASVSRALQEGGVRLIAVSAVQFSTGRVMPLRQLAELAHAHGALLCVDAIQALGILPFDVREIGADFVCGGAHKWLMGIEGIGFVYASPTAAAALRPLTSGWLSHEDPIGFLFEGPGLLRYDRPLRQGIDVLEAHSMSVLGCVALEASLNLILDLGVSEIHTHVQAYNDALEEGLLQRGFRSLRDRQRPSGILSLHPPSGDAASDWIRHLDAHGIAVSGPDGKLRISPHWPNALDEVPFVLDAVAAFS